MAGGRPLKYESVDDLKRDIEAYFSSCYNDEGQQIRPFSITGLALALDTSRQTLMNYEERPEFFDTIKRAKLRVENFYEERLTLGQPTGTIFALKNFDWTDQSQVDIGNKDNKPFVTKQEIGERDKAIIDEYFKQKGVKYE